MHHSTLRLRNSIIHSCIVLCTALLVLILSPATYSQDFEPSTASPYQTIFTHLHFLQPESYQPELSALALDPEVVQDSLLRIKRSIQLKQILDSEGLFVNLEQLPKQTDFVDTSKGKSEYTLFPDKKPQIYLVRKDDNWYYSSQTIKLIPELHEKLFPLGASFLMNLFPEFGQSTFFGLALWQYVGILAILVLGFLFYWIANQLLRPIIRRALKRWFDAKASEQIKLIDRLASAIGLLLILQVIRYALPMLLLPIQTSVIATKFISILQVICITLVLYRLVEFFIYHLQHIVGRTANKMDDQLLPLVKKLLLLIIVAGAILQTLSILNVNVTALIAGVSIGGLALALAAKDAVANFIGSIMIFADKPFQIGDYIVGSGFEGQVEEVGFRTTRIKSIDTSIISVPNGAMSNMNIQNLGVRSARIFNTTLSMTYDSTPDQLRAYVQDLKQLILDHPYLDDDSFYVYVREMAESSINIMFRAYLSVPDFASELEEKEEILFTMMDLAKKHGLEFAFPSRTVYNKSS